METKNYLNHSIELIRGNQAITINISLADDCRNGHNDFSITADIYTAGKPQIDEYLQMAGCCHDEILKARPSLALFVNLHLSDVTGAPMFAIENGYYHLKQSSKETAISYLRISSEEYSKLLLSDDKLFFQYLLESMGIVSRWRSEAEQAIKQLEDWTGNKFIDNSTRLPLKPLTMEQLTEIGQRINNNYYSPEVIKQRGVDKLAEHKAKQIADITADRDKAINKAVIEFNAKLFVLNNGLSLSNFIYYNHTNTGCFNWKDYDTKITKEQFNTFMEAYNNRPAHELIGIKFECK